MALNNVGVTMLEQGNFGDALQVFQDALLVFHVAPLGVDQQQQQQEMQSILLHAAQSRQAKTQGGHHHQHQQPPVFEQLQICPCDDGDVAAMKNVLKCTSAFIPIYLRSRALYADPQEQQQKQRDSSSQYTTKNMEDESSRGSNSMLVAMILYNQGLAYQLLHVQDKLNWCSRNDNSHSKHNSSSSTSGSEHGQALLGGAVACFSTAQALIQEHLTMKRHFDKHSFETLWIMYLLAMVHKSLMWLARLHHQDLAAVQAREMLSRVLAAIHTLCQEHLQGLNVETTNDLHGANFASAA
jgi:type II secretory pathway pseudopilin PulG